MSPVAWLNAFKPVLLRRAGVTLGLWGEAGIGKTFAAQSMLRELSCRGFSLHATAPLPEIARALPSVRKLPVWGQRNLERLEKGEHLGNTDAANAIAAVLIGLAPAILFIEDLHEADAERTELWKTLAEIALRSRGVGILATSRTEPTVPFRVVRLEPMTCEASDALLIAEARSDIPREALEWIHARAAGNPLYTLEFFRYLARLGYLWSDAKRWRWRAPADDLVPVTVEALIAVVLQEARANPELEAALEARAMLPSGSSVALWAGVAGLEVDTLERARLGLEQYGILAGKEFIHPLYREVTKRNLSVQRRRELARRALQAFEPDDPRTAALFVEDAQLEDIDARTVLERAAQIAKDAGDTVQSAQLLERATDHASGQVRGRLALEAAKGLRGAYPVGAVRMAELAVNETDNAEAIYELAELYVTEGRMADANRVLERLATSERDGRNWWARLIFVKSWAGNPGEAIELWDAHPEWHVDADPNLIYRIVFNLPQRRNAERIALAERTLERPDLSALERARVLSVIAYADYTEFRPEKSVERYTEVIRLAREAQNRVGEAAMLGNRASALYDLGRYAQSMADLESALQIHAEIGSPLGAAQAQQSLADVLTDFGQFERAEEMLIQAREVMQRADPSEFLVDCETKLCDLYLAWQPPHGRVMALKHAQAALGVARGLGLPRAIRKGLISLAAALNVNGDYAKALELADEAIALSEANSLKNSASAQIERACALEGSGRRDDALESFRRIELTARTEEPQKILHEIGLEIDRLTNDAARASERLAWFEAHGLVHDANLVRRYFPHLETNDSDSVQPTSLAAREEINARLEVLGPARMLLDTQPISGRGAKRLELLVTLLEARITGRVEVSQLELFDRLYPDVTEDQAAQSLKKIVQLVRGSLGRGAIQTTRGGYALGAVRSDAEDFLETGDTRLWRGAYLEGLTPGHDETVPEALYRALGLRVRALLETDPREAARVSKILLEADPYDLGTLELTLRALRASDNHRSLSRVYDDAIERAREIGEHLPERWQDFLGRIQIA